MPASYLFNHYLIHAIIQKRKISNPKYSISSFAREIGESRQRVHGWLKRGYVPENDAIVKIARADKIPLHLFWIEMPHDAKRIRKMMFGAKHT